jgi:hypothetical protein
VQDHPFDGRFVDDRHPDVLHQGKRPPAVQGEALRMLPLDWPIAVYVEMSLTRSVHAEMRVPAGPSRSRYNSALLAPDRRRHHRARLPSTVIPNHKMGTFIRHTCLHSDRATSRLSARPPDTCPRQSPHPRVVSGLLDLDRTPAATGHRTPVLNHASEPEVARIAS